MLNQIVPKGCVCENKDKLQNKLSQRVIVTKYYANIKQGKIYKRLCDT